MYVYIVRGACMGFEKGAVLSQAQADAYAAQGGHLDHHAVRQWRADPVPAVVAQADVRAAPPGPSPAGPAPTQQPAA